MANMIDLNCDMGESYGRWTLGADEAIMPYITSANIACGFHGGDPHVIRKTRRPSCGTTSAIRPERSASSAGRRGPTSST